MLKGAYIDFGASLFQEYAANIIVNFLVCSAKKRLLF